MNARRSLKFGVLAFAVAGVVSVGSIFMGYLDPTLDSTNTRFKTHRFTEISADHIQQIGPGVEGLFEAGGYLLGMYRPTVEAWGDLQQLDDFVYSAEISTYNEALDLFVYWRHTPHCGILAMHEPKSDDEDDKTWLGGYHDIAHSSSFDYAGRAIKDREYAFRGLSGPSSNFVSPYIEILENGAIRVRHPEGPPYGF